MWSWKRTINDTIEHADTPGLTPPPGEGWTLDGKFGVGKVSGCGESPARSSS